MGEHRLIPCGDVSLLQPGTVLFWLREHSDLPGDDFVVDGVEGFTPDEIGRALVLYLQCNLKSGVGYVYVVQGDAERALILRYVDSETYTR